jgi:hypothetical protein
MAMKHIIVVSEEQIQKDKTIIEKKRRRLGRYGLVGCLLCLYSECLSCLVRDLTCSISRRQKSVKPDLAMSDGEKKSTGARFHTANKKLMISETGLDAFSERSEGGSGTDRDSMTSEGMVMG